MTTIISTIAALRRGTSTTTAALRRGIATALLCLLVAACATSPTGRSQFLLVSPEYAIDFSRQAYTEVVQELDNDDLLLHDPLLADRVARVTGHLVTEAIKRFPHSAEWQWSVALIDEPEQINAWCMAGGRMGVFSGLFEELNLTDDEFAQIMGHEISHALANHTAEQISLAITSGLFSGLVEIAAGDELAGGLASDLANLLVEMPYSRAGEREADEMGAELAARAGYEPSAAVSLWRKMEESDGGGGPPEFLSTHPSPSNRRETLGAMVPQLRALVPRFHPRPHPVEIIP